MSPETAVTTGTRQKLKTASPRSPLKPGSSWTQRAVHDDRRFIEQWTVLEFDQFTKQLASVYDANTIKDQFSTGLDLFRAQRILLTNLGLTTITIDMVIQLQDERIRPMAAQIYALSGDKTKSPEYYWLQARSIIEHNAKQSYF